MEAIPGLFLDSTTLLGLIKVAILLILILYSIFALLIVRQVDLMSKTLLTPVSSIVKGISIIHAGFALALVILFIGVL